MKKLILFIPLVFACSLSTEELAEQVEQNIIETLTENDEGFKVVDFSLVHRGGNEYKGLRSWGFKRRRYASMI